MDEQVERKPVLHELKCWTLPFGAMWGGFKTAEFRRNDRDFRVGDTLKLREWDPGSEAYSERVIFADVLHIATGFGIPDGYVMLSVNDPILSDKGKLITFPEGGRLEVRRWLCSAGQVANLAGNLSLHRILEAVLDAYDDPEALGRLAVAVSTAERPRKTP